MLRADDAPVILAEFGLGRDGALDGPVARGEVGQVWRLDTPDGVFAVKEPFDPPVATATDDEATFQDLGVAAGVPAPHIVRTPAGRVLTHVRGTPIRVYEWVELSRAGSGPRSRRSGRRCRTAPSGRVRRPQRRAPVVQRTRRIGRVGLAGRRPDGGGRPVRGRAGAARRTGRARAVDRASDRAVDLPSRSVR